MEEERGGGQGWGEVDSLDLLQMIAGNRATSMQKNSYA